MLRTVVASGITHVLFAFFAMGAWAHYVNLDHGAQRAFLAAMTQGSASALITALMKRSLDAMFRALAASPFRRVLPWLATTVAAALGLVVYHLVTGTPNLLATISIPLGVSTTYAVIYTQMLARS